MKQKKNKMRIRAVVLAFKITIIIIQISSSSLEGEWLDQHKVSIKRSILLYQNLIIEVFAFTTGYILYFKKLCTIRIEQSFQTTSKPLPLFFHFQNDDQIFTSTEHLQIKKIQQILLLFGEVSFGFGESRCI